MTVSRNDAKVVGVDKDTPGGATYHIKLPGENKPRILCFRGLKNNPSMRCTQAAGYGTSHVGTGACKLHGGADKRPTITTGRQAVQTKLRLKEKIDGYMGKSREELLDLSEQLAATKAIFDEFIVAFPNTEADEYGLWFGRFNALISTMGILVDKVSRIEARNTLTAAQVLYLRATMVDILMKYLPDPDVRERVVKEIASRMGGDLALEMQPTEISRNPQLVDSMFTDDDMQV